MAQKLIRGKSFCTTMKKIVGVMKGGPPWCLVGGRAVEIYTNPPQTPDIDLLCVADEDSIWDLIRAFKSVNILLTEEYDPGFIMFLVDKDNGVEVDVMPSYDPFDIEAISQAKNFSCKNVTFPVAMVEDLVIMKSQAAASAGGGMMGRTKEKVKRDLAALRTLAAEANLDRAYIERTLKKQRWDDELRLLKRLGVI